MLGIESNARRVRKRFYTELQSRPWGKGHFKRPWELRVLVSWQSAALPGTRLRVRFPVPHKRSLVVHAPKPRTQEVEAGGSGVGLTLSSRSVWATGGPVSKETTNNKKTRMTIKKNKQKKTEQQKSLLATEKPHPGPSHKPLICRLYPPPFYKCVKRLLW